MTFPRLVRTTVWLAVFAMALRVSVDTDTWWHLRAGMTIEQSHQILLTDPFSLTRLGAEWHYPGWLAEVWIYDVYRLAGLPGLNLATALAVLATFAVVWTGLEGGPLLRGFVLLFGATASAVYWAARPHVFTLLLTSIFALFCLRAIEGRPRALFWCLPAMALWGNLHGGFAAGLLLLGLAGTGEFVEELARGFSRRSPTLDVQRIGAALRTWGGAALGCLLALLINPLGAEVILYPAKTVSLGVLRAYIQEWQSPDFHQPGVWPFLALWIATFVAMAISRRRIRVFEMLWVVVFGVLAFLAARNIALFAVVASFVLARHAAAIVARVRLSRPASRPIPPWAAQALNVGILLLAVLATGFKAVLPLSPAFNRKALADIVPIDAAEFLREYHPPGALFNSYNWGGYVLWDLYPGYRSFVDGRTDLFGDELLQDYLRAWRGEPTWEGTFRTWGIHVALLELDAPLVRSLRAAGWSAVYQDELAVVLTAPTP